MAGKGIWFCVLALALMLTLGPVGWADETKASTPQVEESVQRAKELFKQAKNIGKSGRHQEAIQLLDQVIALQPDKYDAYSYRASYHEELKNYDQAISDATTVLRLMPNDGSAWGNLGWFLILANRLPEAQEACLKAVELEPGDRYQTANLGHTYLLQRDQITAREWYKKYIKLITNEKGLQNIVEDFDLFLERGWQVKAVQEELAWLREVGEQEKPVWSAYAQADELLEKAQELKKKNEWLEAATLYRQASEAEEKSGRPRFKYLVAELSQAGNCLQKAHKYSEAEPLYERALAISEKQLGPEHPDTATSLNNLAVLYKSMGAYAKAEPLYERALAISEKQLGPEHPSTATSLNNLAGLYLSIGAYAKVEPLYLRALSIAMNAGQPELLWHVQNDLHTLLAKQNKPDLAIFFGKQAVNTIQSLRAGLTKMDKGMQKSFLTDKEDVYKRLSDLLIDQGRLPEAQQVIAMLKEEEYFDYVRRDTGERDPRSTQAAFTAAEAPWVKRYTEISGQIMCLGREREALAKAKKENAGLTPEQETRWQQLKKDETVAKQAFNAAIEEMRTAFQKMGTQRVEDYGSMHLKSLQALQTTLGKMGHGAVVINTLITDDKLRLLLTTPITQLHRDSPVTAAVLNQKIAAYREVLQNPRRNPLPLARELYDLVIAPLAGDLEQAEAKTLMISLDDTLRYLPLAALHDGKGYLTEHYAVVMFTEAAKVHLQTIPTPEWRMAGLGVSLELPGFQPLPAVREELSGLVRQEGDKEAKGVLPGVVYLDQAFTPANLEDVLTDTYPVIHLASHFVFSPGTEDRSFLLLGDGKQLSLADIKNGPYNFGNVDLLTLSACETAVGGKDAKGREVEGFGALAQNQGAKGVMATLWPVADRSTGIFMQNFYRLRQEQHLTKAEALRQAQLAFINPAPGSTKPENPGDETRGRLEREGNSQSPYYPDPQAPYAHPYFWAPFILMGNWL